MFGPRNLPNLDPLAPSEDATDRQDEARVEPPRGAPEPIGRYEELEAGHRRAGLEDPGELAQRGRGVGDVAEEIGEGERVDARVGNGQLLTAAGQERDAVSHPGGSDVRLAAPQHRFGEIDPGDEGRRPTAELERDPGGAGGDVEHPLGSGRNDVVDHRPAPPAVLSEGEHLGQRVVPLREPVEESLCKAVGIAGWLRLHAAPLPRGARTLTFSRGRDAMNASRFDALVVGSGPAGSVAATVLARGGARVALVDKAQFPRDKACGDLVGPRGVQLLADLGIELEGTVPVGDMVVVGPTARRVTLPCFAGRTYPDHAVALPRRS